MPNNLVQGFNTRNDTKNGMPTSTVTAIVYLDSNTANSYIDNADEKREEYYRSSQREIGANVLGEHQDEQIQARERRIPYEYKDEAKRNKWTNFMDKNKMLRFFNNKGSKTYNADLGSHRRTINTTRIEDSIQEHIILLTEQIQITKQPIDYKEDSILGIYYPDYHSTENAHNSQICFPIVNVLSIYKAHHPSFTHSITTVPGTLPYLQNQTFYDKKFHKTRTLPQYFVKNLDDSIMNPSLDISKLFSQVYKIPKIITENIDSILLFQLNNGYVKTINEGQINGRTIKGPIQRGIYSGILGDSDSDSEDEGLDPSNPFGDLGGVEESEDEEIPRPRLEIIPLQIDFTRSGTASSTESLPFGRSDTASSTESLPFGRSDTASSTESLPFGDSSDDEDLDYTNPFNFKF